jgi:hypothetical protein
MLRTLISIINIGFLCLGLAMASRRDFPQRSAKAKERLHADIANRID